MLTCTQVQESGRGGSRPASPCLKKKNKLFAWIGLTEKVWINREDLYEGWTIMDLPQFQLSTSKDRSKSALQRRFVLRNPHCSRFDSRIVASDLIDNDADCESVGCCNSHWA